MFLNVLQQALLNKTDYYPHVLGYYVYNTLILTYYNDKLTYLFKWHDDTDSDSTEEYKICNISCHCSIP